VSQESLRRPVATAMRRLLLLLALCALCQGAAPAPDAARAEGEASGAGRALRWLSPPPPPALPGTYYQNTATCTLTGLVASTVTTTSNAYLNFR